jgi:hypothetical protein
MHFVVGLRDYIKSLVMTQRPSTLDSACALALVQEEAMDNGKKKEIRCMNCFPTGRFISLLIPCQYSINWTSLQSLFSRR